jgi:cytidine deaminase
MKNIAQSLTEEQRNIVIGCSMDFSLFQEILDAEDSEIAILAAYSQDMALLQEIVDISLKYN